MNRFGAKSGTPHVESIDEFYARAYALELEASERYGDLAEQLEAHNNREVAALFRKIADIEMRHAEEIRRQAGAALVSTAMASSPQDFGAPEGPDYADAHYLMTPYHALAIAAESERRAEAYFDAIARSTTDEKIRTLARQMAAEERAHAELVQSWLAAYPEPAPDWPDDPDPPVYSE